VAGVEVSEEIMNIPTSGSNRKMPIASIGIYIFVRPTGRKTVGDDEKLMIAVGFKLTPIPILVLVSWAKTKERRSRHCRQTKESVCLIRDSFL
jgi:hypothetical protein